jgi:hypothetical protein
MLPQEEESWKERPVTPEEAAAMAETAAANAQQSELKDEAVMVDLLAKMSVRIEEVPERYHAAWMLRFDDMTIVLSHQFSNFYNSLI